MEMNTNYIYKFKQELHKLLILPIFIEINFFKFFDVIIITYDDCYMKAIFYLLIL